MNSYLRAHGWWTYWVGWLGRWGPWLMVLLAIGLRWWPTPRLIDDAFITFRYARNLLAGLGFVYNPGELVLGTTTPLYTLLMALLAALTGGATDYGWLALGLNALADGATCWLLWQLGARLTGGHWVGAITALAWAISPMSVTFAIGGMETSVFICLLTLTMWLYLTGRPRGAAFTSALVLLTRPDGALLVGLLGLDVVARAGRARRWPWAEAAIFLGTLGPWVLFATLYFGSPLPHSIAAKALAYHLPPEAALVRLIQHYGTPFSEQLLLGNWWPFVGLVLYLTLSALVALSWVRRLPAAWPLVVYPWLYFLVFAWANPLIFRWYLAPPLPFYFLLILAGVAGATSPREPHRWGAWGRRALSVLLVALSLRAWVWQPDHGPQTPAPAMAWHQLEIYYATVGQRLALRLKPTDVIAAGDVGALGWYTQARILDTVGLMSPEASAYFPLDPAFYVINYAVPPQLILDQAPDYVVMLEVYGRQGLLRDPRFLATYVLIDQIETDIYGSEGLLVFARR